MTRTELHARVRELSRDIAALLLLAVVGWVAFELGRQRGAATAPDLMARVAVLESQAVKVEARLLAVEQPRCLHIDTAERFDVSVYSVPDLGKTPRVAARR